jgi:hypothetical protein
LKKTKSRRSKMLRICALCDEARECRARQIGYEEYDICVQCWHALTEKLNDKGRPVREREIVLLPPLEVKGREVEERKPMPGELPKIWVESGSPLDK